MLNWNRSTMPAVILIAGLSIGASAQVNTVSLPFSPHQAYEVNGLDGVKPHSHGRLTFLANGIQFVSSKGSATVPIAAIRGYSLSDDSREVIPGLGGFILDSAVFSPLFINPLIDAGELASGAGVGMLRKGVSALEFDYVDSNHGLHSAVFLLPRKSGDPVRKAMALLMVPVAAASVSHPIFPKSAIVVSNSIGLKGTGSIRVADLEAGSGGTPPYLEGVIYEQLISQLTSSRYFIHVLRAGEDVPAGSGKLLTLQMSLDGFNAGKPRLHLVTPFGKGKIAAEVRLSDESDTLLRDDFVNIGVGDDVSNVDACRLLSARVAKDVTKTN